MGNEQWQPILGYEGLYEVSDSGRVRSLDRIVRAGSRWGPHLRRQPGKVLRPGSQTSGHLLVQLSRDGVSSAHRVHRLVLEAFIGPCPEGMECCHDDGIPTNNDISNLRWGTKKSNFMDRVRHSGGEMSRKCIWAKLTDCDVILARAWAKSGYSAVRIAERYGVHPHTIKRILNGRTWLHVPHI